jgi:hypothetical protein
MNCVDVAKDRENDALKGFAFRFQQLREIGIRRSNVRTPSALRFSRAPFPTAAASIPAPPARVPWPQAAPLPPLATVRFRTPHGQTHTQPVTTKPDPRGAPTAVNDGAGASDD